MDDSREKIWIETGLSNHLKVYKWVPGTAPPPPLSPSALVMVCVVCVVREEAKEEGKEESEEQKEVSGVWCWVWCDQ